MTCEGCKGFFRLTVKYRGNSQHAANCLLRAENRNDSPLVDSVPGLSIALLWKASKGVIRRRFAVDRHRQVIMSDEAVEMRRSLLKRKRRPSETLTLPSVSTMTEEQEKLVRQLTEAQEKTFDSSFTYFKNYRPARRHPGPPGQLQESTVFLMLPHMFVFAKIMECLTELRTMDDEHSKQLLHIWNIQPDYTPLMHEMFSRLPE
ncbi:hypothetical protein GDO78_015571 [Eleutherodactylus coqui]|uniref:Nuclear receptor domain-containing protein n=1 Tax=Eleutherodactylus coqui TaxID=57060 RepID=A0A8J6K0X6_ELECQ|nr:hypothetical protein GDO78_015571 [Eleutherodactylus coqui]